MYWRCDTVDLCRQNMRRESPLLPRPIRLMWQRAMDSPAAKGDSTESALLGPLSLDVVWSVDEESCKIFDKISLHTSLMGGWTPVLMSKCGESKIARDERNEVPKSTRESESFIWVIFLLWSVTCWSLHEDDQDRARTWTRHGDVIMHVRRFNSYSDFTDQSLCPERRFTWARFTFDVQHNKFRSWVLDWALDIHDSPEVVANPRCASNRKSSTVQAELWPVFSSRDT
jgi:hypothetical protein